MARRLFLSACSAVVTFAAPGAALAQLGPISAERSAGIDALPGRVDTCLIVEDSEDQCLPIELGRLVGSMIRVQIINRNNAPRYVALTRVYAPGGALTLPGGGTVQRLDPGQRMTVGPLDIPSGGFVTLRVLDSDRPFDPVGPGHLAEIPRLMVTAVMLADADEPQPMMGGGEAVSFGDADWMVALYDTRPFTEDEVKADSKLPPEKRKYLAEKTPEEQVHACGGAMIDENIVITAAHCVATGEFEGAAKTGVYKARRIRLGSLRLGKGGETRAIVGLAVHAGYNGKAAGQPNDIALLLLKRDDRIHLRPRPLKIGKQPIDDGAVLVGLGWGYTKATQGANVNQAQGGEAQRNPVALQQAPLEKIRFADCVRKMGPQVKAGMVCLVTPTARREAGGAPTFSCRGDSGGPLVRYYGGSSDELVGLTSWSKGCGKGWPSVYTDVTYFAPWIAAARAQLVAGKAITVPEPARVPRTTRRN